MSGFKYDRHTICLTCRGRKCDLSFRCNECKDWTIQEMEDYVKHRKSLDSKSRKGKQSETQNVTQASSSSSKSETKFDTFKSEMINTMQHFMSQVMSRPSQDVINPSISAPPVVATVPAHGRGADGKGGHMVSPGPHPLGTLQSVTSDPPPFPFAC